MARQVLAGESHPYASGPSRPQACCKERPAPRKEWGWGRSKTRLGLECGSPGHGAGGGYTSATEISRKTEGEADDERERGMVTHSLKTGFFFITLSNVNTHYISLPLRYIDN